MDCCVTLILLFFGFCFNSCSHLPKRKYYYIDLKMNWIDAQHYCRENYSDLATIESMDDISRLEAALSSGSCSSGCSSESWIGLRDDPTSWKTDTANDANSWRWSTTGQTSKTGYHNWGGIEPNGANGDENCTLMDGNGKWIDWGCQVLRNFVCYTVTNQTEKTYVTVSASKTWTSAQAYCREHHTDLAMIENTAENNEVHSIKPARGDVWIGLYRVPWTWSDKTQSSFRSWAEDQPNNYGRNQFCVSENSKHEWDDNDCNKKFSFICHRDTILKTTLRMKIETDTDLTNPATNAQILQQLGEVLTSQGWTDFNLQWNIHPRKQETKEKLTEPRCILHF